MGYEADPAERNLPPLRRTGNSLPPAAFFYSFFIANQPFFRYDIDDSHS
jgi:hypothetical protein